MSEEKIELILNTGSRYITNNEKGLILDYIEYLKSKNNIVESKNIELVIEIERLHNIIKELKEFAKLRKEMYERQENVVGQEVIISFLEILDKVNKWKLNMYGTTT